MLLKLRLCFLAFMAISPLLRSQSTGTVTFIIHPQNAFLSIDNKLVNHSDWRIPYHVELLAGKHEIKVWASTRELFIDTIDVQPNDTLRYVKALGKLSADFLQYRKELKAYQNAQYRDLGIVAGDVALTATVAVLVLNSRKQMVDSRKTTSEKAFGYSIAIDPNGILNARSTYDTALRDFNSDKKRYQTFLYAGIPIIAIANAFTVKHFIKRKKNKLEKPVYQEDNPLVEWNIMIDPGFANNPGYLGLTLKF